MAFCGELSPHGERYVRYVCLTRAGEDKHGSLSVRRIPAVTAAGAAPWLVDIVLVPAAGGRVCSPAGASAFTLAYVFLYSAALLLRERSEPIGSAGANEMNH